jgi:hypothetical protein
MNTSVMAERGRAGDVVETCLDVSVAPLEPMDPLLRGNEQRSDARDALTGQLLADTNSSATQPQTCSAR